MAGALVTTNITQTLVAMGLSALRERIVMPRLVNREYEKDIVGAKRGETVNVAVPSAITTRTVSPDVVPPAVTAVTPTNVAVTLTEWKEAPFAMDDKGLAQVLNGIIPMQASEAIKSLANTIDNFIWGKYKGFHGYAGVAATTPFQTDFSEYLDARKFANSAVHLMDMEPRTMLIDPDAESKVLGLRGVQDAGFAGTTEGIVNGQIGRKLGATWVMTQNVPTHTAGTGTAYLVNNGNITAGSTVITVDTGSGTILEGDIVTFASHSQTYAIVSSVGGSTVTSVTLNRGLVAAIVDGNTMLLKPTHVVNLLMHRDAIAFAMAPLSETKLTDNETSATAIDEESGLSLRLELTRQHKQYQWSWDALYGASVVRPGFGIRVAG